MNSYLLEGIDYVAIEKEVNKIIEKEKFTSSSLSIYDMEETLLENALEDLDTYTFLSDKKTIIIKNIDSIKYDDYKSDFDYLLKYIDNPSNDNLLIIEAKKLNGTYKITKELKKKCKYIELELNSKSFIKNELKDYKINQNTINLLDEYCIGDFTKIQSECDKLKNYKFDEKEINEDDIKALVIKKLGDPQDLTFSFARSISSKDKSDALKKYRELLEYNIEPLGILGLLGSQIRIIYQVKLLDSRGMRDKDIASTLSEKEFRVKKTRELIGLYTNQELLGLMKKLADIDLKIKTTDIDPNTEIELFIVNL